MILGGRTELGASKLIRLENFYLLLPLVVVALLEVDAAFVVAPETLKACTPTLGVLTG